LRALAQSAGAYVKQVELSIGVLARTVKVWTATKAITQSLDVLTQPIRELTAVRITPESISLGILAQSTGSILRSIEATLGILTDSVGRTTLVRFVAQTLEAVVHPVRQFVATRALSESLQLLGQMTRQLSIIRLPSEAITLKITTDGFRLFKLFVSQSMSIILQRAGEITGTVTPPPPFFPPGMFWPQPMSYIRSISEALSISVAPNNLQKVFRTVLQAITSSSALQSITTVPPSLVYERFASTIIRHFDNTVRAVTIPGLPLGEGETPWWGIRFWLAVILLLVSIYFYMKWRDPTPPYLTVDDGDEPSEEEPLEEEPPELVPEPMPVPIGGST
jgi:hypothetical protein